MKRHLILHIGLSKTGSSSIQRVLAQQRPDLQSLGVYYPHSPGWANHALLPASLVNDPAILWGFHPGTWEGMPPAARIARFRTEWDLEMATLPDWAGRCVISAEQIGGLLRHDDEVQRLADKLRAHFATIEVLVYLRRQDQHVASAYSQWLRGGVLEDPALPPGGTETHVEYDYGAMLDRYARVFGQAAVRPRIFSRATLIGGDVIEDFFDACGFTLPVPADAPNKNANVSINLEGQALLLAAGRQLAQQSGNDAWRDLPPWRRFAEAVGERFAGQGWRPTQDEAAEFMARFAATNERAREVFFPGQATLFDMDVSDLPGRHETADPALLARTAIDLALHEMDRSTQREADAAMAQFRLMRRLEDRRGMRIQLTRAVKFAPGMLAARVGLVEFFLEEGDLLQATEHWEAAARIAPEEQKVRNLGRRLERRRAGGGPMAGQASVSPVPQTPPE